MSHLAGEPFSYKKTDKHTLSTPYQNRYFMPDAVALGLFHLRPGVEHFTDFPDNHTAT